MIWVCHVEILYTWTKELSTASYLHLHYKIYNFLKELGKLYEVMKKNPQ